MTRFTARRWPFWAILGLLAVSIPAFRLIPFGPFWGLDLQNLFVFHRCVAPAAISGLARDQPYLVGGATCGDAGARPMLYPPLLYWAFIWLRLIPFAAAVPLWGLVIALGVAALPLVWLGPQERRARRWPLVLFWILMMLQFPVVFSIERANVDLVPVLLWSFSLVAFHQQRDVLAGAFAGFAAAIKLYPAFACAVVAVGLLASAARRPGERRRALLFLGGTLAAALFGSSIFLDQSRDYFLEVMPAFARSVPPLSLYSHSLPAAAGAHHWIPAVAGAGLLGIWSVAAIQSLRHDPSAVFAGGLAISTYFSGTSYDYNLITTYPLLLLQMVRAHREESAVDWAILFVGLLAVVGNRGWFNGLQGPHVLLQVFWLAVSGVSLWRCTARHPRAELNDQPISL